MGIHAHVPPATREHANEIARGLGITLGRYLEILLVRDAAALDTAGKPLWAQTDLDIVKVIPLPSHLEESAA